MASPCPPPTAVGLRAPRDGLDGHVHGLGRVQVEVGLLLGHLEHLEAADDGEADEDDPEDEKEKLLLAHCAAVTRLGRQYRLNLQAG